MNSPPTKYTIARWRLVAEAAVITKEQYEELVAADNADDFERFTAAQGKLENQYCRIPDEAVGFYPDCGISQWLAFEGDVMGGVDDLVNCIPAQSWGEDCLAPRIVSNDYFSYLGITSEASNN